jgi:hypothetical protein
MSTALKHSRYVGDAIFRRTSRGDAVLSSVAVTRRNDLRRMLWLLDGQRSVDAIATAFRASDALKLLGELQTMGLVESVDGMRLPTTINAHGDVGTRSPLTVAQLELAKTAAISAATELLGSTARSCVREIEQCRDTSMLRSAVSAVCERLARVLGADAVAIFVDSVRRAAR